MRPIFIKRDIADVMDLVLDAPVATREGEEGLGVGLIRGEAGDGVGHFGLDLAGGLANAAALNPADLLDVRPGLADAARPPCGRRRPDASILGGVGQGPEDAPFIPSVLRFRWGIHGDGQGRSAFLPLTQLPGRQRWRNGRVRGEGEQRGKKRRQCRLPARVGCP